MITDEIVGTEYENCAKEIGVRKHRATILLREIQQLESRMDQLLALTPMAKKVEESAAEKTKQRDEGGKGKASGKD